VALSPNVAALMTGEGWPFCERTAQAVLWAALTDAPPGLVADVLGQVGADNWREGFPDREYVSVAHALVRAVRGLGENDWLTAMGSAWISYFQWMQPQLLAGAAKAAAGQASAGQASAGDAAAGKAAARDATAEDATAGDAAVTQQGPHRRPTDAESPPSATDQTPRQAPRQAPRQEPRRAPAGERADDAAPVAADPLDDDDEVGYGQLMVSMTLDSRRDRPHPGL
jgi:hypothetical protein